MKFKAIAVFLLTLLIKPAMCQQTPDVTQVINDYEKGQIKDGFKVGIWEYYDHPGELSLKIDYNLRKVLFIKTDTAKYAIELEEGWSQTKVDTQPTYIGSMAEFYKIIRSNVRYPAQARRNSTEGNFHVTFEVDSYGQAFNFRAINDIGDNCGKEVIKALKLIPNLWIPAELNEKNYKSRFILPLSFRILKDGKYVGSPKKLNSKEELPMAKTLSEIVITAYGNSSP